MSFPRRIYTLSAQKLVATYDAAQSVIGRRYQPLAQDASLSTRRGQLGLYSSRTKVFAYTALAVLVLGAFAVFGRGGQDHLLSAAEVGLGPSRAGISKVQYVDAILRDPVEGVMDPNPIRQKCEETKFQENLIWQCAPVNGGIGNVVNMILNCVRYAIEAGVTTLILPRIDIRGDDLKVLGQTKSANMSYLLDTDYFLETFHQVCPKIHAVVSETEIPNLSASPLHLSPPNVKSFPMRKYLIIDPTGWREAFDQWLAKNFDLDTISADHPAHVWENLAFAQWNREAHSIQFANSFPRLFRHPLHTRRLAASALWNLEKRLSRPIISDAILFSPAAEPSPSDMVNALLSDVVNSLGSGRLTPHGYLGAHLRVAEDATAAGWPGYEAQAPFYISEAKRFNLTTIFLGTGSDENLKRFRDDTAREGIEVIVKEDILEEGELRELKLLTWDQQALIDFDILMLSTQFSGFVRSTFSWAIALRRSTLPEAGVGEWSKGELEYRDNLSSIVGRYNNINPEGLWP